MGFWSNLFGACMGKTSKKSHGCCGDNHKEKEQSCCQKEVETPPKSHGCCGGGCHTASTEGLELSDEDRSVLKTLDSGIRIGQVLSVEAHPDPKMTKVQVTQVSFGSDPVQVLCGGINVSKNQIVAVATVGAKLSEDFEIGNRKIRGVESNGMICARSELGLSPANEKKGEIWALPESCTFLIGTSLKDLE